MRCTASAWCLMLCCRYLEKSRSISSGLTLMGIWSLSVQISTATSTTRVCSCSLKICHWSAQWMGGIDRDRERGRQAERDRSNSTGRGEQHWVWIWICTVWGGRTRGCSTLGKRRNKGALMHMTRTRSKHQHDTIKTNNKTTMGPTQG